MAFEPVYSIGDTLYINLTNRCHNACTFCIREERDGVGSAESLWLEREPEPWEVVKAWMGFDPRNYAETVFCGYGEPTERLSALLEVSQEIKSCLRGHRLRLNTNGQGSLLAGRDIAPELAGRIDCVSVSLNAVSAEEYVQVCRPKLGLGGQGEAAFDAMLAFTRAAKAHVPEVVLSIVAGMTDEAAARKVAESVGVPLRVREMW